MGSCPPFLALNPVITLLRPCSGQASLQGPPRLGLGPTQGLLFDFGSIDRHWCLLCTPAPFLQPSSLLAPDFQAQVLDVEFLSTSRNLVFPSCPLDLQEPPAAARSCCVWGFPSQSSSVSRADLGGASLQESVMEQRHGVAAGTRSPVAGDTPPATASPFPWELADLQTCRWAKPSF